MSAIQDLETAIDSCIGYMLEHDKDGNLLERDTYAEVIEELFFKMPDYIAWWNSLDLEHFRQHELLVHYWKAYQAGKMGSQKELTKALFLSLEDLYDDQSPLWQEMTYTLMEGACNELQNEI